MNKTRTQRNHTTGRNHIKADTSTRMRLTSFKRVNPPCILSPGINVIFRLGSGNNVLDDKMFKLKVDKVIVAFIAISFPRL